MKMTRDQTKNDRTKNRKTVNYMTKTDNTKEERLKMMKNYITKMTGPGMTRPSCYLGGQ